MVKTIALQTGITVQFSEQGSATGIPVVFLHGVTDSWRSFEPVMNWLPPTVRALSLTQRGHGGSGKPAGGYGYTDFAADLRAFLDALHLPYAVVVGHSMGSLVAQRFAADHPERVAGLVLLGAFGTLHERVLFEEPTLAALGDPVDVGFITEFQVSTVERAIPPELLAAMVEESRAVPARVWRATFRAFRETPDFSPELARLRAPVLIMWGDRDPYALSTDQDALRAAIPGARLLVHSGGGHAIHWEDPVRVANDLMAFLYERRELTRSEVVDHARRTHQYRVARTATG